MGLHAKVPLIVLFARVHVRGMLAFLVFGGAGC